MGLASKTTTRIENLLAWLLALIVVALVVLGVVYAATLL